MTGCNVRVNGQSVSQSGLSSGGVVPRAIGFRLSSFRRLSRALVLLPRQRLLSPPVFFISEHWNGLPSRLWCLLYCPFDQFAYPWHAFR